MLNAVAEKLIDIFEGIIQWMFDSLIEPFTGIAQLKDLVFGRSGDGKLVWGTFQASDLTDAFNPLYTTMMTLAGFFLVAFIVLYGMRIAGAPLNPQRRNESMEMIKDLLLVGIVLFNLPTLYDLLFSVNQAITGLFGGAYDSNLDKLNEKRSEEASGVIGYIFIQLILLGLMLWANFYYLMRKVTLIILMSMGPLMLAFWLHPQTKPITSSWLKELIGSIFVQSIHAFVFWTVATVSATSSGFVETVIVYLIFIPISESVRKLLLMGGDMQGGLARAGSMLGLGALAGMYGAVKGAIGDKSVMGALKESYNGIRKGTGSQSQNGEAGSKETMGALPGSDIGTSPTAEKMLKAGDIFSRSGKAVFGMAGAVAGSPMGPAASIMGATGASAAGGVAGGLAGRAGAAAIQGLAARNKLGIAAFQNGGIGKNGQGFEENLANELADRETTNWADQNKASELNRLRELHPDATNKELEDKFDHIKTQKRAGFYSDAKANFAAAKSQDGQNAKGAKLVEASSQAMANQWADDNKNSFYADYEKENPRSNDESQESFESRRAVAFQQKKTQMLNGFAQKGNQIVSEMATDANEPINKKEFMSKLGSAMAGVNGNSTSKNLAGAAAESVSDLPSEDLTGNQVVRATSQAMADQWANDNKNSFFADYKKSNPRAVDESQGSFESRQEAAFQSKKIQVQNGYEQKGRQIVSELAPNGTDPISKTEFISKLGTAVGGELGSSSLQSLKGAANQAVSHVQGENVLQNNGKPNTLYLTSRMANSKTEEMGRQFISQQMDKGVSQNEAHQMWNQKMPTVHQANLSSYKQNIDAAGAKTFTNGFQGSMERMGDTGVRTINYLAASSGIRGMVQGTKNLGSSLQSGFQEASASLAVSSEFGNAGFLSHVKGFKQAATEGIQGTMTALADSNGGVLQSQVKMQNMAGYTAGVLLGTKGYQIGKAAVSNFSPLKEDVQNQIKAPAEVIQMAQTIIDENGNQRIAPGAIRQITTPNESFIEVRTKSGETQVVSRTGAGHSGMRNGDVVYQDLDVQGETLVASNSKNGSPGTYRVDSGGGRVPASITISNDPNELLGNPQISDRHKPSSKVQLPSYSQNVDTGQFFVEDIQNQGMNNLQVVIESDRQFVTAQKEGITYRVSPIYSGDTRLMNSDSIQVPVEIKNNQLKPTSTVKGSNFAVNGHATTLENSSYTEYPESPGTAYYSSKAIEALMPSKAAIRAQRGLDKRIKLDEVRRKQGLLG
ncbi:hypothetical protein B14911_10402 [Bacillus sp. NRRL B-14911]|uniref:type IV secretion system protein n=1 Tax=Bacillus sp. NRRL B-14911 TaxID=313627 RepID=UPI00006B59A7|nr:type IV secretion system protein [Bacillus sp. NRRL B-14911]EAR66138.1 hypothetical protein B14911_10402 [Bacillus sp. NRRL B-14911]